MVVPVIVTVVRGDITPNLTICRTADSPPVTYKPGRTRFRISKDNGASSQDLLEFATQLVVSEQVAVSGKHKLEVDDDKLRIEVGGVWLPLPSVSIDLNAHVLKRFRFCRPEEYSALRNYSSGEFSIAKLKLQFPPLTDDAEWQDADSVDPSSQVVKEHVPIVDLRFSELVENGGIGFNVHAEE